MPQVREPAAYRLVASTSWDWAGDRKRSIHIYQELFYLYMMYMYICTCTCSSMNTLFCYHKSCLACLAYTVGSSSLLFLLLAFISWHGMTYYHSYGYICILVYGNGFHKYNAYKTEYTNVYHCTTPGVLISDEKLTYMDIVEVQTTNPLPRTKWSTAEAILILK